MSEAAVKQEVAPNGDPIGPQPINGILNQFRGLPDEMSIALAKLVRDVHNNSAGKGGELVLKMKVEKTSKQKLTGNQILVSCEIKVKSPSEPASGRVLFFDEEGGLHINDPYQKRMFDGPRSA